MLRKVARFIIKVCRSAVRTVTDFFRGVLTHAETIAVLVLASFGATALIGELPFFMALPMWFEQTFLVPVLSVLIVVCLIKLAEWRAKRRTYALAA